MAKQPTATDARLILKLYDLRREAEMRKARHWMLVGFWPDNYDAYSKIAQAMGSQENNWLRQVFGYWDMAASLAVHGAVSTDLFVEPAFSGEMFFLFAKVKPLLKEIRTKGSPTFLLNVEKVVNRTKSGRELLKRMEANMAARRKAAAKVAKA